MRLIVITVAGAAAILAGAANAQAPSTERPAAKPPAPSQEAPAGAPTITSVKVVEIDELPEASKAQVNQLVATRTADELEKLRQAVEKGNGRAGVDSRRGRGRPLSPSLFPAPMSFLLEASRL